MGRPISRVSKVVVSGPLAPFVAAYVSKLEGRGYTPLTTVNALRMMALMSRWLEGSGLTVADLNSTRVDQFVEARRAAGYTLSCSGRSLVSLVEMLVEAGVVPVPVEPAAPASSGIDVLLDSFRCYLLKERALADSTAAAYVSRAGRFLAGIGGRGLDEVTASDVTAAVLREADVVSVGSTQFFVVALRSFLRFCFIDGLIEVDLSAAALAVTGRRRSSLPQGIAKADADALLASCDRRRSDGRRDYAVLLSLLRLGLRASEVAGLRLDDIDWRAAEIEVRGKARRVDRLPLSADVGAAIAGYLERGRPPTTSREVFQRTLAPIGALGRGGVSYIVRRACARAGVTPIGAHRLRHTVACEMVAAGVPLPAIGQVLRHRSLSSTAIYARVDIGQLRGVAQPWLGGAA